MYHFDIRTPSTLSEAMKIKADLEDKIHPLAGGTDILVSVRNKRVDWGKKPLLLNLNKISELRFIEETENTIEIGPLMTHSEIAGNKLINKYVPALAKAVNYIGSPQIRNRGTIAGNLCHASPAGDSLPILYTRNAFIELSSVSGSNEILIDQFVTGPGMINIDKTSIVTKISIPKLNGYKSDYLTLRQRKALSCNVVSVAAEMLVKNQIISDIRIALGAVSPTVIRGKKTESLLRNKKLDENLISEAESLIQTECNPIDDVRSNQEYRRAMTGVLLARFLQRFA